MGNLKKVIEIEPMQTTTIEVGDFVLMTLDGETSLYIIKYKNDYYYLADIQTERTWGEYRTIESLVTTTLADVNDPRYDIGYAELIPKEEIEIVYRRRERN